MANLALLVPVLLLAVFVEDGDSVRCWTCSSDLNPYCGDPFLVRGDNNYLFRLENCDSNTGATYPYLTSSKSSCKKQKKYSDSVRCWTCSSDLNSYCGDPFLVRGDNDFRVVNCESNTGAHYPYLTSTKSSCKKQKKYINGQLVISRGCTWKRADDYSYQCPSSTSGPNEILSYCETCDYDGCNGASTIAKTLALLLAPLGLLLFK